MTYATDQATAVATPIGRRRGGRGGREGLRRGSGRQSLPGAGTRPAGPDQRPGGDRQAGHRRRDRRPAAGPRPGRKRERRADGLPGQHRGRHTRWPTPSSARSIRAGSCPSRGRPTRPRPARTSTPRRRHRWATSRRPSTSCPTRLGPGSGYNPLYPFAFGLSYTTFGSTGCGHQQRVTHGTVTASFTVANTGSRAGTDIVPVYVHQPVSLGWSRISGSPDSPG